MPRISCERDNRIKYGLSAFLGNSASHIPHSQGKGSRCDLPTQRLVSCCRNKTKCLRCTVGGRRGDWRLTRCSLSASRPDWRRHEHRAVLRHRVLTNGGFSNPPPFSTSHQLGIIRSLCALAALMQFELEVRIFHLLLWAQNDLGSGAPLNPNKQTSKIIYYCSTNKIADTITIVRSIDIIDPVFGSTSMSAEWCVCVSVCVCVTPIGAVPVSTVGEVGEVLLRPRPAAHKPAPRPLHRLRARYGPRAHRHLTR